MGFVYLLYDLLKPLPGGHFGRQHEFVLLRLLTNVNKTNPRETGNLSGKTMKFQNRIVLLQMVLVGWA
jgi:hypothetical protein